MHGLQPVEKALHRRAQCVVGGVLVGEQRVTAYLGQLDCVQDGPEVRLGQERHVGVPPTAEVEGVVRLGDDLDDLGMIGPALDEGVGVELAEAATKGDLLFRCQLLVAEEQHVVLEERPSDLGDRLVARAVGEIDPLDVRTEHPGGRTNRGGRTHGDPLSRRSRSPARS